MGPLLYRDFIISFIEICKFEFETGRNETVLIVMNRDYDFQVRDA